MRVALDGLEDTPLLAARVDVVADVKRRLIARVGPPGGVGTRVLVAPEGSRSRAGERVITIGRVQPDRWNAAQTHWIDTHDPLAIRVALLRFRPGETAALSPARLRRAFETLERWRFKMSGWKDQPPAPAHDLATFTAFLVDDLDTPCLLRAMHDLEMDHTVSSGAKYRTFRALDELLAVDLLRKCGHGFWWSG
ncbi:hypothetical protein [Flexivirga oryzae]|uniref:Uncharacterized protein n=1 Tax=Flexivirga oryzae TaxID=1794944 RepID=A0A839NB32_9MICO|nr:hypothetical protein [Flexivirga oryzae]MBB2891931.1 hypothetical protein [Flexivirga oryzae]